MPDLLRILSAPCPRRQAMEQGHFADPCGIHCPGAGHAMGTPSTPVPSIHRAACARGVLAPKRASSRRLRDAV